MVKPEKVYSMAVSAAQRLCFTQRPAHKKVPVPARANLRHSMGTMQ